MILLAVVALLLEEEAPLGGPPLIIPRARLQTFSAKNQSIDARELVTVVRSQAIRPRGLSLKGRASRFPIKGR